MRIKILPFFLLLFSLFLDLSFALTAREEEKYGREIHREIMGASKINSDLMISFYAEEIKRRLELFSSPPYPLTLTVIESRSADAFATIGGYIYVTTGLIELCETEEEFAGVLAHEIAHLVRKHVAKRLEKEKYLNIGRLATFVLAMLTGDAKAREAIIASGMGAIQSVSLMYSREDEEEADSVGSLILEKAGFGCAGISDFLKRLRATSKEIGLPQYLLTHPYHEERISKLELICKKRDKEDTVEKFFPYVAIRAKIINRQSKTELLNQYLKRYSQDKKDTASIYGASFIYAITGRGEEALNLAKSLESRFKNLFLGEILFLAKNYKEAIEVLGKTDSPYGLFILARSYEEKGDMEKAKNTYRGLLHLADSCPEIYLRLGMVSGRSGDEARGFEYLGRYYFALGREIEARMYLEKAITKYGINSEEAKNLMALIKLMENK
jgi:predicted Zn-dependent protease